MNDKTTLIESAFELAFEMANQAGELLRNGFYAEKQIESKSSAIDWVTQFDTQAEELIVNAIRNAFPNHSIMGEEGSRIEGITPYRWYVDPIDGTNNFAHQFPVFCTSIAFYEGETPLCGIVLDPLRNEAFSAIRGQGAYLDSPVGRRKLSVTSATELNRSLIATGFPYDHQTNPHNNIAELALMLPQVQGIRRPGAAALDVVYVAAGRVDGYWEFGLQPWDMAAARLIVEEAGGKVTLPDGSPVVLSEPMSLLVTNGHIHEPMLAILKQAAQ